MAAPQIYEISPFDAAKGTDVTFKYSGNQVYKNRLIIRNNTTNVIVYDKTQTSMQLLHTIAPNSGLTNGVQYNAQVCVYDVNGTASTASVKSLFYCFTTPVLSFVDFQEVIYASEGVFELTYSQAEDEELDESHVTLYDTARVPLYITSNRFGTNNLTFNITGLQDNTMYYVRAEGITVHGMSVESDYMSFSAEYINPSAWSMVLLENNPMDSTVKLQSNIVYIDGEYGYTVDDDEPSVEIDQIATIADGVYDIDVDSSGNIYIASPNGAVSKLDSNFNTIWSYTRHSVNTQRVRVGADGCVYSAGYDATVCKMDSNGQVIWTFSGDFTWPVTCLEVDKDNNVYAGAGYTDNIIYKLKSDGTQIWQYKVRGDLIDFDIDSDGNAYCLYNPNYQSTVYTAIDEIGTNGVLQWECYLYNVDDCLSIAVGSKENVYIGSKDGTVYKCCRDAVGWSRKYSSLCSYIYALECDASGNIYYAGNSNGILYKLSGSKTVSYADGGWIWTYDCYNNAANLWSISKIKVDERGNIYLVDGMTYNRIVKLKQNQTSAFPIYLGGEEIDLTTDGTYVRWYDQFTIPSDFTARIRCRDLTLNKSVRFMTDGEWSLYFTAMEDDLGQMYIALTVSSGTFPYLLHSNTIPMPSSSEEITIVLQRINGLYNIALYEGGGTA